MDRFSLYTIYVSLLALAEDPSLWKEYDGGDERLLLRRDDYKDPENSKLFADLAKREALTEWVDRLVGVCHLPYASIPAPADFLAGRFDYARFVPGGPRPVLAPPPPPIPVFEPPPPAPPPPPPKTITLTLPRLPNLGPAAWSGRKIDWITPAIVVVLLALAGIFHDAILHFAFPATSPPPAEVQVPRPAPRPAQHLARPPAASSHVAAGPKPAPAAVRAPETAATAAGPPAAAPTAAAAAQPAAKPAVQAAQRPHPALAPKHVADAPAAAHVVSASNSKPARHRDAANALLDAAAGDVAAPRCATPNEPARLLSEGVTVSKHGAGAGGGSADVLVSLSASGDVSGRPTIVASSGSADLDAAAVEAAENSRFAAALSNCVPVASSYTLHVRL